MLRWLVQSVEDQPEIAAGHAPAGLFSPEEASRLARFTVAKRRRDWLLGRYTAKQLLRAYIHEQSDAILPLDQLVIAVSEEGAPYVAHTAASAGYLPLSLSISHSHGVALCALHAPGACATRDEALSQIGADVERVEVRDTSFVTDFFTSGEIDRQAAASPELRDTLVTAVWSAKEAALKALHVGLRADTRCVECELTPGLPVEWTPFAVRLTGELAATFPAAHLDGWWRTWQTEAAAFVLTLVLLGKSEPQQGLK